MTPSCTVLQHVSRPGGATPCWHGTNSVPVLPISDTVIIAIQSHDHSPCVVWFNFHHSVWVLNFFVTEYIGNIAVYLACDKYQISCAYWRFLHINLDMFLHKFRHVTFWYETPDFHPVEHKWEILNQNSQPPSKANRNIFWKNDPPSSSRHL